MFNAQYSTDVCAWPYCIMRFTALLPPPPTPTTLMTQGEVAAAARACANAGIKTTSTRIKRETGRHGGADDDDDSDGADIAKRKNLEQIICLQILGRYSGAH